MSQNGFVGRQISSQSAGDVVQRAVCWIFFAFVTVWHSAFLPHSLEDTLNWILFTIKSCHFPTHFVDIQLD